MLAAVRSIPPSRRANASGDGSERAALRAAIAAREKAAAVVKHRGAISRAREIVASAERKADRAGKGVREAKTVHADRLDSKRG